MYKITLLLVSVCVFSVDLYDVHNDELENILNRYKSYKRSLNYEDDRDFTGDVYPERSYYRRRDSSKNNNNKLLNKILEDFTEYSRNRPSYRDDDNDDVRSRSKDENNYRNFLGNQHFHNNNAGGVDTLLNNKNKNKVGETLASKHELRMPGVVPKEPDTYLCYAYELPKDDSYITKFEPIAEMKTAHHMLLFGCETPFRKNKPWQCREMQPVCGSGGQAIKYAWGKNAPSLTMPEDVGFHVGGKSLTKYLVVQIHYLNVDKFKDGKTKDRSGLSFTLTTEKPKYFAGIYLLAAGWPGIPPHKEKFHMDMGCLYNSKVKFFPFRFRVHAHKLGAVITAYRVRDNKWKLIGRGDPQRAQAFYKVMSDIDIQNGDTLMGRCTYNSTSREKNTYIGATHSDEMCNFYMMYFYDAQHYGNIEQLPCAQVPNMSDMRYPQDSDVTLGEVEKKSSLEIHSQS